MRWGGESVTAKSAERIVAQGIAQVMEGRRILAELTVEENLLAGAYAAPRGHIREDLDKYYTRFPVLGERRRQAAGIYLAVSSKC